MHAGNEISDPDFARLRELIQGECGIVLAPAKRPMLETRLRRRTRALAFSSVGAYCEYLFSPSGMRDEVIQLIDVVTTNKTDFFREHAHFEYLVRSALPVLEKECGAGVRRTLVAWSAACSTGEEPYTLGMVLSEYAKTKAPSGFRFRIEATDISTAVLETAVAGVYAEEAAQAIPAPLRAQYVLRSKDERQKCVRVAPQIRAGVRFRRLNLMDTDYHFSEAVDIAFCRNVLIYFDRDTQEKVLERIISVLRPGGFLM